MDSFKSYLFYQAYKDIERLGNRLAEVEPLIARARTGKREVLNKSETGEILAELNRFFENRVEVKRIRHGEHQTLETLINEEAQLFAKYLWGESKSWVPRIPGT
jgi:hypothetical protein